MNKEREAKLAGLLEELSDVCDEEGFQLVAVILNGTPDTEGVTPIDAWHPEWVAEFRKGCQDCIKMAEQMTSQLAALILENKQEGRVQ